MDKSKKGIYVEIVIRSSIDEIWRRSQDPALHELWDLRFSEIRYLPRPDEKRPQRFGYSTRIGFGTRISGEGESIGSVDADGVKTSALRFWSAHPFSLIKEGSGYWKYVALKEGVRFFTWYDYETRWGWMGRLMDAFGFRPLIAWATAWSFDRLRRWIEKGQDPALSWRLMVIYALSRGGVAFIWLYHGLVTKLIAKNADEWKMLVYAGFDQRRAMQMVIAAGILETAMSLGVLFFWRSRALLWITISLMVFALVGVVRTAPIYLTGAFNPVTLNFSMILLASIALLCDAHVPNAAFCIRSAKTSI